MTDWKKAYRQYIVAHERDAEVYASTGESFEVGLREGEIETYEVASDCGICLRVLDGSMGYAATENMETPPDELYELARTNARLVESGDESPLYGGQACRFDTLDEALPRETADYKIALAKELNRCVLEQDARIKRLKSCCVITSARELSVFNTLGLDAFKASGFAVAYASAVAEEDGAPRDGSAFRAAKSCAGLDVQALAKEAALEAISQLGATSLPSGKYDVIIRRDAAVSLLGAFLPLFSGEAAQKGLSLLAGKEGEKLFADCVSIADAPGHPLSALENEFDAEGVPCRESTIVERGRLNTLLHNLKTAAKAGGSTTGNAGKAGLSAAVSVRPNNFYIMPGEQDFDSLCQRLGTGLIVTHFAGLHAGTNAVSGDFSLQCRGFYVERGEKRPVAQIALAGNFIELLSGIEACGADLRFALPGSSCLGAPSLLARELAVSGE